MTAIPSFFTSRRPAAPGSLNHSERQRVQRAACSFRSHTDPVLVQFAAAQALAEITGPATATAAHTRRSTRNRCGVPGALASELNAHCRCAIEAARAASRRFERTGVLEGAVCLADSAAICRHATAQAHRRMAEWFPGENAVRRLPRPLAEWFELQLATLLDPGCAEAPTAFTASRDGRTLRVHLVVNFATGTHPLFLEEDAGGSALAVLTPREREIAHWLAEGKANAEIAVILGMAPRTVSKHIEHIFSKLGVENRTSIAAFVLRGGGE
jgi:DNA-binding CsgD family transcriptional regulator